MPRIDVNATCISRGGRNAWDDTIALAFRAAGFAGAVVTPAGTDARRRLACWVGDSAAGPWPDVEVLKNDPEWAWASLALASAGLAV